MNSTTTYTNCGTLISAIKANVEAFHERLQQLYPCVEDVTKLPQTWSPESKAQPLGLTFDYLGCYFRGNGRRDEDEKFAAAARTDQCIPPSCMLYYFEITFVSKGREGFMGLGLTTAQTHLTKLPGWARESYGYHADDGNKFNGDGRGSPFGPTFTTGDVIGCGLNLVEGKCFFTKNGLNLGVAFEDIPSNIRLYPTIGLKTPGEEVRANFGQEKFVYDIESDLRSLRKNMTLTISNYPIKDFGDWQKTLHQLVQSWLLQNSYPNTAEAFSKSTKLECKENLQRIQQRNRIQQLVLNGKISDAIKQTNRLCPNLLQNNPNLLFALKCRQFIELISGAESDYQPIFNYASQDGGSNGLANKLRLDTANGDQTTNSGGSPNNGISTSNGSSRNGSSNNNGYHVMIGNNNCDNKLDDQQSTSSASLQELMDIDQPAPSIAIGGDHRNNLTSNSNNNGAKGSSNQNNANNGVKMDSNGNNNQPADDIMYDLDEEKSAKLIQFGQELSDYLHHLDKLYGKNELNEKMLSEAIGLIAYTNPKKSCLGKLLDPQERESISQLLNSSIVKAEMGESYRPPLEDVMSHLKKLVDLNDSHGKWLLDELY